MDFFVCGCGEGLGYEVAAEGLEEVDEEGGVVEGGLGGGGEGARLEVAVAKADAVGDDADEGGAGGGGTTDGFLTDAAAVGGDDDGRELVVASCKGFHGGGEMVVHEAVKGAYPEHQSLDAAKE